jgi:hypothetical protein
LGRAWFERERSIELAPPADFQPQGEVLIRE